MTMQHAIVAWGFFLGLLMLMLAHGLAFSNAVLDPRHVHAFVKVVALLFVLGLIYMVAPWAMLVGGHR